MIPACSHGCDGNAEASRCPFSCVEPSRPGLNLPSQQARQRLSPPAEQIFQRSFSFWHLSPALARNSRPAAQAESRCSLPAEHPSLPLTPNHAGSLQGASWGALCCQDNSLPGDSCCCSTPSPAGIQPRGTGLLQPLRMQRHPVQTQLLAHSAGRATCFQLNKTQLHLVPAPPAPSHLPGTSSGRARDLLPPARPHSSRRAAEDFRPGVTATASTRTPGQSC